MSKHVLVLEDDINMHEVLVETLEDEGFTVEGVYSGEDALKSARQKDFVLVVSDVRLGGIDGIETLELLKKDRPDLRTIVITGYASRDSPARAIKLRVDDYLMKPFGIKELVDAVNRVLSDRQAIHKRLFHKVYNAIKGNQVKMEELFKTRERLFIAFYVAIRSGHVMEKPAREVYRRLEELESPYRILLREEAPSRGDITQLEQEYQQVVDFMGALEKNPQFIPLERDSQSAASVAEFRHLFQAVKEGRVTPDELMYAPFLRSAPRHILEKSSELAEMKGKVWPPRLA